MWCTFLAHFFLLLSQVRQRWKNKVKHWTLHRCTSSSSATSSPATATTTAMTTTIAMTIGPLPSPLASCLRLLLSNCCRHPGLPPSSRLSRIFNMLPGLRCAAHGINVVLYIDSAQHLLPSNCNDTAAPTTTFLDLDLSFYVRTTPLQHCRTNFHDAAYLWNSNVPTPPACHLSLTTLTLSLALHWHPTTPQPYSHDVHTRLWGWHLSCIALP